VELAASRLRVRVLDSSIVDAGALAALGLRGLARPALDCVHVIVGPTAGEAGAALRELLS
jgi:phosphotransferase system IIB component